MSSHKKNTNSDKRRLPPVNGNCPVCKVRLINDARSWRENKTRQYCMLCGYEFVTLKQNYDPHDSPQRLQTSPTALFHVRTKKKNRGY